MARKIINPQRPPILWSTLKQAIDDINDNFEDIYTNGIDDSTVPIDLSGVAQDILPDADSIHDIGSASRRWRDIYLSGDSIDLGGSVISRADDGTVNVPGLSEQTLQPSSVLLEQTPANGPFPETPVIIDRVTAVISANPEFLSDKDYAPSVYSAILEDGVIVEINVDTASSYKTNGVLSVEQYADLNTGTMYALPSTTNINDYDSIDTAIRTAVSPYGEIPAFVNQNSSVTIIGERIRNSVQGLQGLQGLQGAGGTQGFQGLQGVQGGQGVQGLTGATGNEGNQGIQGTTGPSGTQGFQGLQGNNGIQGIQGDVGIQGTQGDTGSQGIQGLTGSAGPEGPQGIQGVQGTDGAAVFQGLQGLQGEQGIQGIQGDSIQGIQGVQGSQGIQGTSTVFSRTTVTATATSLADDATANVDVVGFKGYVLYKVETSHAAWVRIYVDSASRTADASRLQSEDPLPGAGIVAELISTGAETVLFTPAVYGFNNDNPVDTDIYVAITNLSGSTNTVIATMTVVQAES